MQQFMKRNLPKHIFDSAKETINYSTVAITGHKMNSEPMIGCHGSGTFSKINNLYGILTAKHVWDMLDSNKEIQIIALSFWGNKKYTYEKKQHFRVYIPDRNIDICFIEIPISRLSYLKGNVTFFPLMHCPLHSSIKNNFLVVSGFPFEGISEDHSLYRILYYFTDFRDIKIYNNWDEIFLTADYDQNPNLIKSFEGISGGAIWGFRIFNKDPNGVERFYFKDSEVYIAGVNYYQTAVEDNKRLIKGIGPITIYNLLYNYISEQNNV